MQYISKRYINYVSANIKNKCKTEIYCMHKYSNLFDFKFHVKADDTLFTNNKPMPLIWP